MAGVFPTMARSRVAAFLLFIVLVWIAVDLGKLLAGLAPLPEHVRTLMDPNSGDQNAQTKL